MKLNLGCGNDIRVGFVNVDIIGRTDLPPSLYIKADITNLDVVAGDNTVEEMIAIQSLQGVESCRIKSSLENWHKKLVSGGVMKIMCLNLKLLCESFADDRIDIHTFEQLMFGEDRSHKSVADASSVLSFLVYGLKMTLLCKRQNGYFTYFEVSKP